MAGTFTGGVLWRVKLTAAEVKIFTAGALPTRLQELGFCNTDTVDRTVQLWIVPAAGARTVDFAQFFDFPVPAKTTVPFPRNFYFSALDEVWALASAANVVACWGSGVAES